MDYLVARLYNILWISFSCTQDKDIRVFHLCLQIFSCIPDKDIRVFHLCLQILSHPGYLTLGWIKITCI